MVGVGSTPRLSSCRVLLLESSSSFLSTLLRLTSLNSSTRLRFFDGSTDTQASSSGVSLHTHSRHLLTPSRYLGVANESPMDGLVFEEALGGNLQKYILAHHGNILPIQRHRWCAQAAQTLAYCHKRGVLHCDLRPENFLLDEHLDLLMCDFGGSSLEGHFEGLGLPDYGFFDPTCGDPFTVTAGTEIFGLGSVMFFIMAGALPYESQFAQKANDVQDYAIAFAQKLRQHKWAEVEGPMASIIQGCWTREFASVEEVVLAMARRRLVLHESYHCLDSVPT